MASAMPDHDVTRVWPSTLAALVLDGLAVLSFVGTAFLAAPSTDLDYAEYWALIGVIPGGLSVVALVLAIRSLSRARNLKARLSAWAVTVMTLALVFVSGFGLLLLSQGSP